MASWQGRVLLSVEFTFPLTRMQCRKGFVAFVDAHTHTEQTSDKDE